MKQRLETLLTLVLFGMILVPDLPAATGSSEQILAATGVKGGLVVHLGCGDGRLTAALHASDSFIVQGLDADVTAARNYIRSLGLYGPVSAEPWSGARLPYIDNLVNLVVADDLGKVPMSEVLRVLAPLGVAYIGGKTTVKPWPTDIDEWTHYLHGPANNAVAHDTVIGPPRHMQWLGGPTWTRNHDKLNSISAVVTARGRLFYIVDEATGANLGVPGKWSIVARNGFSGVKLWERPMPAWVSTRIGFRTGPVQVTRLLVASGDRLYAPLSLNAPVSELDAATGTTCRSFDATGGAEEIVLAGGVLLVVKGEPVAEQAAGHERFKGLFKLPNRKSIVAIDVASGATLWTWSAPQGVLRSETLGSDGRRAFVQVGEGLTCLDLKSGKLLWESDGTAEEKPDRRRAKKKGRLGPTYGTHTLVVADDVVLCNLAGRLTAVAVDNGKTLWSCPAGRGFHSPLDIFVIKGLVWQGSHASDSVAPAPLQDFSEARDLHTGEVKETNHILVDLQTAGHHHRCYREKATDRYILTGKRGIELMDLEGNNQSRNNWVRGTCQYGIMPANGLLYAPSHDCACYMESLLKGFWALSAQQPEVTDDARKPTDEERLEKGPAYGAFAAEDATDVESWPQYRHDPLRSGIAGTVLPAELKPAWKTQLDGRLTQPVIAGGKVLLASIDENTVYALDAATGKVAWKCVCGGRVDSPPAVYANLALFGSADGWVYCLRLTDGALVWRFLAAPADLRAVAYDRVESVWPVHGSVLVLNGVAYCSAGRSTWVDGGMELYGIDPATGKVICQNHFKSRHPVYQEGKDKAKPEYVTRAAQNTTDYKTFFQSDRSDSFSMAGGATSDVLVSDGRNVFLRQVCFDAKLEKQDRMMRHLFATFSLLDDAENHRGYWMLGSGDFSRVPVAFSWIARSLDRWSPTLAVPAGLLLAYDDNAIWGVRRKGNASGSYDLYMKTNTPFSAEEAAPPDFRSVSKEQIAPAWSQNLPVRPRAMLKSGSNLYLGATPVEIPADDPGAAYEGRLGGMIWVVSAKDGAQIAEHRLDSPVVWDGLAAANGGLYAATVSGQVLCYRRTK